METEELVGAEQEEELCKKKWSQMHSFLQFENTRCAKNVSNTIYIPSYITYVILVYHMLCTILVHICTFLYYALYTFLYCIAFFL